MAKPIMQSYLKLIKHGIILGNLVPVIAGFCLGLSLTHTSDVILLLWTLFGLSLVIASATIINNIIDRDIDQKMTRTQNRPLINGDIKLSQAIILAILSGLCGFMILYYKVNLIAGNLALIGFIDYVLLYSLIFKRHSSYSILIGSISGAIPPLVGYVAVSEQLDLTMLYLFIIFSSWQVIHSYAIALYRREDYQKANIPMPPLFMTRNRVQQQMLGYTFIMFVAVLLLIFTTFYFIIPQIGAIIIMVYWLGSIIAPIRRSTEGWGKEQFLNSLWVIMALCFFSMIDRGMLFWL